MDAVGRQVENNLEGVVAELEEIGKVDLPKQDRLVGPFLVSDRLIVAKNYHGSVEVYSLGTGEKITSLFASVSTIGENDFAVDGRFLYLNFRGEFRIRDSDIVLADFPKLAGDSPVAEFSGLSIASLRKREFIDNKSENTRFRKRIVSVPLEMLSYPSEIWDCESFLSVGKRFLVTESMGLNQFLHSAPDHAVLHYKSYSSCEGLFDSSLYFKNGDLYEFKRDEREKLWEIYDKGRRIPAGVSISRSHCNDIGMSATNSLSDPERLFEREISFPMSIIFKEGRVPGQEILNIVQSDDKVYALTGRIERKGERPGITYITDSSQLITYQLSLKRLSPIS